MKNFLITLTFSLILNVLQAQDPTGAKPKTGKMKPATEVNGIPKVGENSTKPSTVQSTQKSKTSSLEKAHICSASCKDNVHFFAHGEKGHTCSKTCQPPKKSNTQKGVKQAEIAK